MNYGTDAGLGYVPSDAPVGADTAPDGSAAVAGEATAAVLDGGSSYDASVDGVSGDDR